MSDKKLAFMQVDTTCLPEDIAELLQEYRDAEKKAKAARAAFEVRFTDLLRLGKDIPAGHNVVFGYRFGGLAIAFAPVEKVQTSTKPKFIPGSVSVGTTQTTTGKRSRKC